MGMAALFIAAASTSSLPPSVIYRSKWQVSLKGTATDASYPVPLPAQDRFIVSTGGKEGGVYAVDAESGKVLWKSQTPGGPVSLGRGKDHQIIILVASEDGKVYGLDAAKGSTVFSLPTEIVPSAAPVSADVTGDGIPDIVVVSATAGIGAYDGKDFKSLWVYSSEAGFLGGPLIRDFTGSGKREVLVTDRSGKVAMLDGATGKELWTATTGNASVGVGALWDSPSGRLVIIGNRDNWVYAFRAKTGELAWRYYVRTPIATSLFMVQGPEATDLAVFCAERQGLQALNLRWQFLQWRYDFPGNCVGEPLIANVFGDDQPEVLVASDRKVLHTVTGGQAAISFLDMLELPAVPVAGPGILYRGADAPGILAITVSGLRIRGGKAETAALLGYSFKPLAPPLSASPLTGLGVQGENQ